MGRWRCREAHGLPEATVAKAALEPQPEGPVWCAGGQRHPGAALEGGVSQADRDKYGGATDEVVWAVEDSRKGGSQRKVRARECRGDAAGLAGG